jgi:hypothetical protein
MAGGKRLIPGKHSGTNPTTGMQLEISPTLSRERVKAIAKETDKYPFFNVHFVEG